MVFGKPIAGYQLTQQKLAEMALEINRAHARRAAPRPHEGRGHAAAGAREHGQDGQRPRSDRGRAQRAHDPRRQRHHARVPGDPPHEQSRVGAHVRGHARGAHARRRPGAHRARTHSARPGSPRSSRRSELRAPRDALLDARRTRSPSGRSSRRPHRVFTQSTSRKARNRGRSAHRALAGERRQPVLQAQLRGRVVEVVDASRRSK